MKNSLEKCRKKFRTSAIISIIAAIAFAFATIYPKGEEVFTQHMGPDGPGIIEYRMEYTLFEDFLMDIAPILLLILIIFVIRTVLLYLEIRKLKKEEGLNSGNTI